MALVVVSGAIANKRDQGGEAWVRLSYLLGLRRLGYQVHLLEQIAHEACVDATGKSTTFEASAQLSYFRNVVDAFGLANSATLLPVDRDGEVSLDAGLLELANASDALLNISGHLAIEPLLSRFRKKVFIDIDPGYTQYWHAAGNAGARLAGHDWYFTIGENIGSSDCLIPVNGIPWRPTRPPVVLDEWPIVPTVESLRFTTIANWRGSYGVVQFGDQTFGQKVHEFRKVLALPQRVPAEFEIALSIHPAEEKDLAALKRHGWRITDPLGAAATPDRFRQYVQQSGAEFSVAQGIYVVTNSGWFSDRTVRYLASGKPVLVQDTGFSRHIPTGRGIVAFQTLDDAVRGAKSIVEDYADHAEAARGIAEQYFDSDKVLGKLLAEIGIVP